MPARDDAGSTFPREAFHGSVRDAAQLDRAGNQDREGQHQASHRRQAGVRKAGAKLRECLWTLGQYDLVLIVEAPSDEVIAALGINLGMLANVKSCTLRAWGEREMEAILKKV
jgi:uncharacterized protein with GYD domain